MSVTEDLFADRYRLERRLGVGGMSTVQLAFDTRLERYVAVKLLAEHLAADDGFVQRFRREALAAARLVHPNVVQVYDFGTDEGSHRQFIAMEYVEGHSGAELLREQGRMPADEVVDLCAQACRGLDYAHRNGVVHRDIKPGNLLRNAEGLVKIADFGIAKAADDSDITRVGAVIGTAAYLAPEQARGEPAGPASDLYALGVVAYQLMSGRLPYEAQSLTELALKQQREEPPLLDQLDRRIPHGVALAVAQALEMDPARRPQSAEAFRAQLARGAAGEAVDVEPTEATSVLAADPTGATRVVAGTQAAPARRLQPSPGPPTPPPMYQTQAPRAPAKRRRGRSLLTTLLLLGILAVAAVGLYLALSAGGGSEALPDVTRDTVGDTVSRMQELIDDNTR
jgi:serine/threonine-protein kinase